MHSGPWPCVSLTYDGGSLGHLESVVPDLDARGLTGTFFASPEAFLGDLERWRRVATQHEIGNGSLFGVPLEWSGATIRQTVAEANEALRECFPGQDFAIALDWDAGVVPDLIAGAPVRAGMAGFNHAGRTRLDAVRMVPATNATGLELVDYVETARKEGAWLVFAFDGIGEGERAIDLAAHRRLLDHLDECRERIPTRGFLAQSQLLVAATVGNPRLV